MSKVMIKNELVGKRILERRRELGITQSDVAKELEVSSAAVSLWEKGKAIPSSEKLYYLADILQCNINWLLMGSGGTPSLTPESSPSSLTPDEEELLELYSKIPRSERPGIIAMLKSRADEFDKLFQELLESRSGRNS